MRLLTLYNLEFFTRLNLLFKPEFTLMNFKRFNKNTLEPIKTGLEV